MQHTHQNLTPLHQAHMVLRKILNRLLDLLPSLFIELRFWWSEDLGEDADQIGGETLDGGVVVLILVC